MLLYVDQYAMPYYEFLHHKLWSATAIRKKNSKKLAPTDFIWQLGGKTRWQLLCPENWDKKGSSWHKLPQQFKPTSVLASSSDISFLFLRVGAHAFSVWCSCTSICMPTLITFLGLPSASQGPPPLCLCWEPRLPPPPPPPPRCGPWKRTPQIFQHPFCYSEHHHRTTAGANVLHVAVHHYTSQMARSNLGSHRWYLLLKQLSQQYNNTAIVDTCFGAFLQQQCWCWD